MPIDPNANAAIDSYVDTSRVEPRLDTLTLVSIDTWTLLDTFGHYRHVRH
jgi:hypothetical protein